MARALTVAHSDLSGEELSAYGQLIGVILPQLTPGEHVAHLVVHGADLVAFTDTRIVSARRGLFDYALRRPRIRSISYSAISELVVEGVGQSAAQLRLNVEGRRRPIRLYFPTRLADELARFLTSRLRPPAAYQT